MRPRFQSINPATGEAFAAFPTLDDDALEVSLAAIDAATRQWGASPISRRVSVLHAIAAQLRAEQDALARIATLEMGKTYLSAQAEVEKCAAACTWYAEHGPAMLRDTPVTMPSGSAVVKLLPLGVVLAIMPWNFPYWQVFRCIAPMLMAGNGVLLKHAANVPQCALAIERVVRQAGAASGLPPALVTNLFVDTAVVPRIIDDPRIAAVTLTGSERAGMSVAAHAGQALKKCVLELGGSDPFIVMPSADLPRAVKTALAARMNNNGQSCICAKRLIVHDAVYDRFETDFVAAVAAMTIGDPMQPDTALGPICTGTARDALDDQVHRARQAGGIILTGGMKLDRPGFYYAPTVIAGLPPAASIAREEFFGPVALLFKVADRAAALQLANDVPFGLGSTVWTQDDTEADYFIDGIAAGITAINTVVASDPRVPFGGVKRSGYGRELAELGLREFVNVKTVLKG